MPTCTPALVINGTAIRFTNDKLVNLTDLWHSAGEDPSKRPTIWLRQQDAQAFIKELAAKENVIQDHIIKSTRGRFGGTFAHWQIALAYAKYLSPEFHIHCNNIIRRFVEEEQNPDMAVDRAISAYLTRCVLSSLRCIKETRDKISSASFRLISHFTRGSCAVGFLNMPYTPFNKLPNPFCSALSLCV